VGAPSGATDVERRALEALMYLGTMSESPGFGGGDVVSKFAAMNVTRTVSFERSISSSGIDPTTR
jgi:hypothetical protein